MNLAHIRTSFLEAVGLNKTLSCLGSYPSSCLSSDSSISGYSWLFDRSPVVTNPAINCNFQRCRTGQHLLSLQLHRTTHLVCFQEPQDSIFALSRVIGRVVISAESMTDPDYLTSDRFTPRTNRRGLTPLPHLGCGCRTRQCLVCSSSDFR